MVAVEAVHVVGAAVVRGSGLNVSYSGCGSCSIMVVAVTMMVEVMAASKVVVAVIAVLAVVGAAVVAVTGFNCCRGGGKYGSGSGRNSNSGSDSGSHSHTGIDSSSTVLVVVVVPKIVISGNVELQQTALLTLLTAMYLDGFIKGHILTMASL